MNPSEVLVIGHHLLVQILDVNKEKERISLGIKQMQNPPVERSVTLMATTTMKSNQPAP